jgi:hypothetical protein
MTRTIKKEYIPGGSKRQDILNKAVEYIATWTNYNRQT